MQHKAKYPQLANIVFLHRAGDTLRSATKDISQEALPEEIVLLLRRLERLEKRNALRKKAGSHGPAA